MFTLAVAAGGMQVASAQDDAPALTVLSPAAGETITTDDITIEVQVDNFTIDCAQAGRPDEPGVGHIHVMLDGMTMANLTGFYCTETITISGEGLAAGPHMLIVGLSTNTHLPLADAMQQIEFDYQPENPRPLPEANFTGEPGVELVSPADGATVPPVFTIELSPVNFTASSALEGKGNVPGYGHWHVFVDTPMDGMGMMDEGDMDMASPESDMGMASPESDLGADAGMDAMAAMPMPGMVAMPGENTFELDLSAWGPGEHTIWIEPVQSDHTMFESFGHVEFTVIVDPDAEAEG